MYCYVARVEYQPYHLCAGGIICPITSGFNVSKDLNYQMAHREHGECCNKSRCFSVTKSFAEWCRRSLYMVGSAEPTVIMAANFFTALFGGGAVGFSRLVYSFGPLFCAMIQQYRTNEKYRYILADLVCVWVRWRDVGPWFL